MENLNKNQSPEGKNTRDGVIALLKEKGIDDPEAKMAFAKLKSELRGIYGGDDIKFYASIADLYKDSGLMSEAKDSYYQAATIADRESRYEEYEEYMKKFREIDAPML